jgi:hypothetical protein
MFNVPVKLESIENRKRGAGVLHVLAGLFFAIKLNELLTGESSNILLSSVIIVVAIISIGYGLFRRKLDPNSKYNSFIRLLQFFGFILLGIFLININSAHSIAYFAWAAVTLILFFAERKVFNNTNLKIAEAGIHVPGFFSTHVIPWNVVERFVLRPDYLTIFRTNQKFVQLEITQQVDNREIEKINEFSKNQIEKNKLSTQ